MFTKSFGNYGEDLVKKYCETDLNYKILHTNYICGTMGEIDIVAKEGKTLVFIEVKSRNDDRFMPLYETINKRKKDALIRAANYFITANHFNNRTFRIDLATYDKEKNKINYYRNILD